MSRSRDPVRWVGGLRSVLGKRKSGEDRLFEGASRLFYLAGGKGGGVGGDGMKKRWVRPFGWLGYKRSSGSGKTD